MGTDIHIYIERKRPTEDVWDPVTIVPPELIPDDRNHIIFEYLFGVGNSCRDYEGPLFANRGLPPESELYERGYLGEHSFTYVYLDELMSANWKSNIGNLDCYFKVFSLYILPRLLKVGRLGAREVRLIVGFDS